MSEQIIIQSNSPEDTEQLGEQIGTRLKGGEVIELISDLGGGKTTFTRGLANGAKSEDRVASPTFTVSKVYNTPGFKIHHFDFYRLKEAGLMEHEISELLNDPESVVVVEWGTVVKHVLPDERLTIEILQSDSESRAVHLTAHPSVSYLIGDK